MQTDNKMISILSGKEVMATTLKGFLHTIKNGVAESPFIKSKPEKVCFAEIKNNKVKSPTCILALVYKYPNENDLSRALPFFESNEYVYCCFRSVPAMNLVVLVQVDPVKENDRYVELRNEIGRHFNKQYLTSTGVSIMQFIPFNIDNNLYLNEGSRVWGQAKKDVILNTPIEVKPVTKEAKPAIVKKPVPAQNSIQTVDTQILSQNDGIIYDIVSEQNIRFNELAESLEFSNGVQLNDRDINNIALQARSISKNISDTAVTRVLYSNLMQSFHPFDDYIKSIENRPVIKGTVDKFLKCLVLENHHPDYLLRIVKKWFGGLMGTLMGSYSVMTLVFVGQQGNGKTSFFRGVLLPPMLKRYFVESEIIQDKDVMVRMCSNFILYDDEFTSKNKTEASQQKQMASADRFTYRKPYGRIDVTRRRTAVLCGSANEPDVISDHTGNRRIIPARLKNIDHKQLATINIDDFYRELLEMHYASPTWWHLTSDDIAFMNADTQQNTAIDEFEERVLRWTTANEHGHVSTTDVSRHISAHDCSYRDNVAKLGRALTKIYGSSVQAKVNGSNIKGYKIKLVNNVSIGSND